MIENRNKYSKSNRSNRFPEPTPRVSIVAGMLIARTVVAAMTLTQQRRKRQWATAYRFACSSPGQ
jgi:hypothetical protein